MTWNYITEGLPGGGGPLLPPKKTYEEGSHEVEEDSLLDLMQKNPGHVKLLSSTLTISVTDEKRVIMFPSRILNGVLIFKEPTAMYCIQDYADFTEPKN